MAKERQRLIQPLLLSGTGPLSRDIPRDTCLKGIGLRLSGAIQTTFASGTPVARADGIMHSLINTIQVVANGGRTIKSVQPHMLRMMSLISTGLQGERGSSAAAGAATTRVTTNSNFTFGTTTQYTSVNEYVYLPFEFIWAKSDEEKALTWLDTRDLATCELRLIQNPYTSLQSAANTAPVAYGNSSLQVEITLIEAVDAPKVKRLDYRQTTKDIALSAQVDNLQIDINRGNALAGLLFYAKNGAAGSTTTASDRLADDNLITSLSLKKNGREDLKSTTWFNLSSETRARNGILATYSSNVSQFDGVAHMNFVQNTIKDVIDTGKGVDSLYLFISSASASVTSYTNTAYLTIQTDEIAEITQ